MRHFAEGEKAPYIQAMFSGITRWYDLLNTLMSFGLHYLWRNSCAEALRVKADDYCCDLCCGTGDLANTLGERCQRRAVGSDFVEGMLQAARRKYPDLTFINADALHTPFADGQFTVTTNAFALRNVESPQALLQEMVRITAPGGRVLTLELTRPLGWLGKLHHLFLSQVIPAWGKLFYRNYEAYRYLFESIEAFVPPVRIAEMMREKGLVNVRIIPLSGGICTICIGQVRARLD